MTKHLIKKKLINKNYKSIYQTKKSTKKHTSNKYIYKRQSLNNFNTQTKSDTVETLYLPLECLPSINSLRFTLSASSPLSILANSVIAVLTCGTPKILPNSASASAIRPCYVNQGKR